MRSIRKIKQDLLPTETEKAAGTEVLREKFTGKTLTEDQR